MTKAVVPGTYDPITLGHVDVITRATRLFDEVIVAVAASERKGSGTFFTLAERVEMTKNSLAHLPTTVLPLQGLLVSFCSDLHADVVVKGLRATTDFEYELAQADINSKLAEDLESVFIMTRPNLGFISSSAIREMAALGADISAFVPKPVAKAFQKRI